MTSAAILVGLTSDSEPVGRIAALRRFAGVCVDADDAPAARVALEAASKLLVGLEPGARTQGLQIASLALDVGRQAESIRYPLLARQTYRAGLRAIEGDPSKALTRGILWQEIGDTWGAEGIDKKALSAYRTAVQLKQYSDATRSRLISLNAVVRAEAKVGPSEHLDDVIDEGLRLLEATATHSTELEDDFGVIAHGFGLAIESTGQPALARRAYELTLTLVETGLPSPTPGYLVHDIGDTWLIEGKGPQAIAAYRSAAGLKSGVDGATGCVGTLTQLAVAELKWGERSACEDALAEAVALLPQLSSTERETTTVAGIIDSLREIARLAGRPDLVEVIQPVGDTPAVPTADRPVEEEPV